jgi:ABC-type lipoprotein export system ATPase subunit/ABC-type antimicrobial peptide transport system permease subunit
VLQLEAIRKSYTTADFTQVALDDVSIAFRDNEFVAILGPSGSGKTTLLNLVGGLDHYDSGDLIIDGVSTREYKDRDWDTYRNNRIGFVFQSYNLIPHQSVVANVELALTLSGVGRTERRARAVRALEEVGLGDHINKRPSQLSGGQMQRVAIARALINDPEILLADEPTGALDSKTSDQVMDLLTRIASNRLVVMVTHNPDLAARYANRVVHLNDGAVVSDSRPFQPTADDLRAAKEPRQARMSFLTAVALSFSNLMTKKGRTLMTSFAGSIGIIGIAAILALANGVNNYIKSVEEDSLSLYPLSIQASGIDLTAMLMANTGADTTPEGDSVETRQPGEVTERNMVSRMFASVTGNDLASLKAFLDSGESGVEPYVNSIQYDYSITPQVYLSDTTPRAVRVNPDQAFDALGMGGMAAANPFLGASAMSAFTQMLDDPDLLQTQYDVVAGHWPEDYDELVVVLTESGRITDFMAYALGLRDHQVLEDMVTAFVDNETGSLGPTVGDGAEYSYDQLLGVTYKLAQPSDFYQHDTTYDIWTDRSDDPDLVRRVVAAGETLRVVGILQPNPDASANALLMGINYPAALTHHLMTEAAKAPIVRAQLAHPDRDVFTGETFAELIANQGAGDFDLSSLISIDESAISSAFEFDPATLDLDLGAGLGSVLNPADLTGAVPALPQLDFAGALGGLDLVTLMSQVELSETTTTALGAALNEAVTAVWTQVEPTFPADQTQVILVAALQGWFQYALANGVDLSDNAAVLASFQDYLADDTVVQGVTDSLNAALESSGFYATLSTAAEAELQAQLSSALAQQVADELTAQILPVVQDALQAYLQSMLTAYLSAVMNTAANQVGAAIQASMAGLMQSLPSTLDIDPALFATAFQFNLKPEDMAALLATMMSRQVPSLEQNLTALGYADEAEPSQIDIYPIDFESKQHILDILNGYNDRMRAAGADDKVITYTDIVGVLMSSVTDIIDTISYVLVAFVSISLVVSSIMIGVITYISVLERKKEIGILRSIGASKRDIRRVFNAETLIVGGVAGVLGIVVTWILTIPANAWVEADFGVPNVAILPPLAALALIGVSMALTFIAGLLPSSAAARADPVEALRSE